MKLTIFNLKKESRAPAASPLDISQRASSQSSGSRNDVVEFVKSGWSLSNFGVPIPRELPTGPGNGLFTKRDSRVTPVEVELGPSPPPSAPSPSGLPSGK